MFRFNYLQFTGSLVCLLFSLSLTAQKQILDHADFNIWNTIEDESISPDGTLVMYSLERGEADKYLRIKSADGALVFQHDRAGDGVFSWDSQYAFFTVKPWRDSLRALKRRKVKKKDLPLDSLGIYERSSGSLQKIPRIHSYKVPEKWSGFVAYQVDPEEQKEDNDSTESGSASKKKKPGKKNGYPLIVRELLSQKQDTFHFVTDYRFAKEGKRLTFISTGETREAPAGVFVLNLENGLLKKVHEGNKAHYYQLNLSDSGAHLGFVADLDTTKAQLRPTRLYYWNDGLQEAELLAGPETLEDDLRPSRYAELHFSRDESRMFFGLARPPVMRDTSLLEEEIAQVEVWTYDEPRLYTVQEMQVKNDTIRAYTSVVDLDSGEMRQLAKAAYPDTELGAEGNAGYALVSTTGPYDLQRQWTGMRRRDYALIDLEDGAMRSILTGIAGQAHLSPSAGYVYGYDRIDSTWFSYNIREDRLTELTRGKVFYNELHDSPSHPSSYGLAGWTEKDKSIILYDRYDLWEFNPDTGEAARLTRGRETQTRYRYAQVDREERFLDGKDAWLLTTFDEAEKGSGYASLNPGKRTVRPLLSGPYRYTVPVKARQGEQLLFTRESFEEFPDLRLSDPSFSDIVQISDANPQQEAYNWGSIELVSWRSLDGKPLTGMLVKPENFDPSRKYPMIVNFYEKSSDRLHRHRAPSPGRSTINYAFYASRGYLIFNPDVYYRTGYPGESAYNCVIPGVTSLIESGFVDAENIGVQGHSWGGYQIAHLVTKTDIFKAAEAGAPVPNMISAYGGIRWWTGLSRQFQYEHTQSRIGGTPWEYPMRYLENSPIFNIDKINTPLLIMHNDADGHVPWYQGIEFFMSLRRLGKPSWFLNYNGEPHWPLKRQNREDFNIRMAQFFDHYLKGAPKPVWMERGVPAVEKGVNQGYELLEDREK